MARGHLISVFIILVILQSFPLQAQQPDPPLNRIYPNPKNPDQFLNQQFRLKNDIYHIPPSPVYNIRPYFLEFVVDIPIDSIKTVTLYHRTDSKEIYQMTPLKLYRGLYRYKFDPTAFKGKNLEYFLIVTVKYFGIQAYPLNEDRWILPGLIVPVEPQF